MKRLSQLFFLVSYLCSFSGKAFAHDKKPWVYFDLGDTVVNTKDMKHLKYMSGAREYIDQLKREGFNVGIITNIPEDWGMSYEEKLETLKKVIQEGWEEERPFDWSVYDEIILPLKNTEMKPTPTLFLKAISKSGTCPSAYVGESPKEIAAAKDVGMAAQLYVSDYLPIHSVKGFIAENYKRDYDKDCM